MARRDGRFWGSHKSHRILCVVALLLSGSTPWVSAATWSRVATYGEQPSERSSPALGLVGPHVYLFGGVQDTFATGVNRFYNDLFRFDPQTRQWIRLVPEGALPPARAFAAAAVDTESALFFLFGGTSYGPGFANVIAYNDLWAYSPSSNSWTKMRPSNPGPCGRSRPAAWMVGRQFYLFGGITAEVNTLNDLWRYDLASNRWTELIPNGSPASPPSRHQAQSGSHSRFGKLVIYGGETLNGNGFEILGDTWEYDLAGNRWTEITPLNSSNIQPPRNYGAAGIVGTNLYLQGGDLPGGVICCGASFPQNPTGELWRFDLQRRTWEQVQFSSNPVRLKRHSAIEVGNEVLYFGGFDFEPGRGQIWNREVFVFRPSGQ